jgi:hypothetical protein
MAELNPDIFVRVDFLHGGACAPEAATIEEVNVAANTQHQPGTVSQWAVEGESLPCLDDPSRRHWRLVL